MAPKSRAGRKSRKGKRRTPTQRASSPRQMTSEEALDFIRRMQKRFPKPPVTKKEKADLQQYLAQFTDTHLKAVGSRVQSDLMRRQPRTIHPGDFAEGRRGHPRRKSK